MQVRAKPPAEFVHHRDNAERRHRLRWHCGIRDTGTHASDASDDRENFALAEDTFAMCGIARRDAAAELTLHRCVTQPGWHTGCYRIPAIARVMRAHPSPF